MGTVAGRRVRRRGEAGYAMLDSLIALALVTVTLFSIGFTLTSALNRQTELIARTAAAISERNVIAGGRNAENRK